jgi:hypothetical protein
VQGRIFDAGRGSVITSVTSMGFVVSVGCVTPSVRFRGDCQSMSVVPWSCRGRIVRPGRGVGCWARGVAVGGRTVAQCSIVRFGGGRVGVRCRCVGVGSFCI